MSLAKFQTNIQELSFLQNSWGAQINPVLSNPIVKGIFLTEVFLNTGNNVLNHLCQEMDKIIKEEDRKEQ